MADDSLNALLWCVHKIISNRRRNKSAKIEHIVGEMNAAVELQLILEEVGLRGLYERPK